MFCFNVAQAQISARLFQHPDVSDTHIAFVYGGDIWTVAKEGGVASKLSSPEGQEAFPRFSPDGSMVAFSGNYKYYIDNFGNRRTCQPISQPTYSYFHLST